MADEGSGGGSWWGGWVQTAKEKTTNAYEFMKHDLTEFGTTVSSETTNVAQTVKNKITQENVSAATAKAKQGVSTIIGGISKALVIEAEDLDDPGIPIDKDGVFDRKKSRLRAIQLDTGTYLNEPAGPIEQFEMWLPSFNLDEHKGKISELLVANVEVRGLYTQMVPGTVPHGVFWQRYFYKVHQLEQDEQRKLMLMKRADVKHDEEDDLAWDDDEDFGEVVGSPARSSPQKMPSQSQKPTDPPSLQADQSEPSSEAATTSQPESSSISPPIAASSTSSVQTSQPESVNVDKPETASNSEEVVASTATNDNVVSPAESASLSITTDSSLDKTDDDDDELATANTDSLTIVSAQSDDSSASIASASVEVLSASEVTEQEEEGNVAAAVVSETVSEPAVDREVEKVEVEQELRTKEKGELVVVSTAAAGSSDRTTPSSDSLGSSNTKESTSGLDDDWEQDFDIEVTEEDLKLLDSTKHKQLLDEMDKNAEGDDWENWE